MWWNAKVKKSTWLQYEWYGADNVGNAGVVEKSLAPTCKSLIPLSANSFTAPRVKPGTSFWLAAILGSVLLNRASRSWARPWPNAMWLTSPHSSCMFMGFAVHRTSPRAIAASSWATNSGDDAPLYKNAKKLLSEPSVCYWRTCAAYLASLGSAHKYWVQEQHQWCDITGSKDGSPGYAKVPKWAMPVMSTETVLHRHVYEGFLMYWTQAGKSCLHNLRDLLEQWGRCTLAVVGWSSRWIVNGENIMLTVRHERCGRFQWPPNRYVFANLKLKWLQMIGDSTWHGYACLVT